MREYGSVSQDGKTYKTVVIAGQTWMAENLNYTVNTTTGSKCYNQGVVNVDAPPLLDPAKPEQQAQIQANCDKYGRLYDWATAMKLPANCNNASCGNQVQPKHKGICPDGWHIPSEDEWNALKDFIEDEIFNNYEDIDFGWDVATKLKAIAGWKDASTTDYGVDSYGFGAIGSGYCVSCEDSPLLSAAGYYSGKEEEAHWWSSTEFVNPYNSDAAKAYKSKITYNKKVMNLETEKKGDYLYSVRCMKD